MHSTRHSLPCVPISVVPIIGHGSTINNCNSLSWALHTSSAAVTASNINYTTFGQLYFVHNCHKITPQWIPLQTLDHFSHQINSSGKSSLPSRHGAIHCSGNHFFSSSRKNIPIASEALSVAHN